MAVERTCKQALEGASCKIVRQYPAAAVKPARAVAFNKKAAKSFADVSDQARASLLTTFTLWCEGRQLPDGKHKRNEGRTSRGGRSVLRQAFAAQEVRIYGSVETVAGVEVFLLVDADLNKKRQRADPALLAEVSKKLFDLIDELERNDG